MNTKRPNYFTGQFLKADDFNTEQAYHIGALREHNKVQHTWGVAEGLDVTFKAGSPVAHVKEGTAIDADGKLIYLSAGGFDVDFSTITSNATTFYITIEYSEKGTDATSETGVTGNTRIEETPAIATSETLPTDQSRKLVLAQVALVVNADNSKSVDSVDTSVRKNSGVVAGDLEARSLSLSIDDTDKSLWPQLKGVKSGNETKLGVIISQSDFSGQLKVNGAVGIGVEPSTVAKLQVGGSLKVTGNVTNDQNLSIGGRLSVTGTSELSGGLSVTGDSKFTGSQSISSNLNVGGDIVVNGNLDVKGTTTTINTTEMEVSDNIIRVNKYSPQAIPKKVQGGLEVFRGGTEPEAQIIWDEGAQKWMAGKAGALSEIPIGPFSVDVDGNVGIGTADPNEKFEVNGHIIARPIIARWYPSSHLLNQTGGTQAKLKWDKQEVMTNAEYFTKSADHHTITFEKEGFYMIISRTLVYISAGDYGHFRMLKNGNRVEIDHSHYPTNTSWDDRHINYTGFFSKGDTIEFEVYHHKATAYGYHHGPDYTSLTVIKLV